MIRDRKRIAAKLRRIEDHIRHRVGFRQPSDYLALGEVARRLVSAEHDPEWKWLGFATEIDWARHASGFDKLPVNHRIAMHVRPGSNKQTFDYKKEKSMNPVKFRVSQKQVAKFATTWPLFNMRPQVITFEFQWRDSGVLGDLVDIDFIDSGRVDEETQRAIAALAEDVKKGIWGREVKP